MSKNHTFTFFLWLFALLLGMPKTYAAPISYTEDTAGLTEEDDLNFISFEVNVDEPGNYYAEFWLMPAKYIDGGKGCIMVFAAGNGFIGPPVNFPANYNEDILAVGNIRKNGMWNETSAIGNELFIGAPGTNIFSTLLYDTYGDEDIYRDTELYYDTSNTGTSFACPHVSGTIALMLELNPDLSISQIREILARTAKKVGHLPYSTLKPHGLWNECYGYGIVDAAKAVKATPRN